MLDFNHRPNFTEQLNSLIDKALVSENNKQPKRDYLGASRIGEDCTRKLQYEYTNTPKDKGFSGRILRIFSAGHLFEDLAINWLKLAGFELITEKSNGEQFGFSAANGRIRGHVDGIINAAPEVLGLKFPMLWECKSMNAKSWRATIKHGVTKSKPVYAAQIAVYQAYMEGTIPGISKNPALFTAINKDTAEILHELVPFDSALAQKMSDKSVRVLQATDASELLPRVTADPEYFQCHFCDYNKRCWNVLA